MFSFLARAINLTEFQHSQIGTHPSGISNENQQQQRGE
jgi:hypothetical protein